MFAGYSSVLRVPGAAAFSAAGALMRLPIGLYPVSLVLLVSLRTGEYTFAGYLSGVYVAGGALGNPVTGRLADRLGQHRVLLPSSVLHAAAVLALVGCTLAGVPRVFWLVPTVLAGVTYVAVGALVRARWSALLPGSPLLGTAFSLESTVDETIFVTGPLLATFLATVVDPLVPLVLGVVLVLVGAVVLARLRGSEPPRAAGRGSAGHVPLPRAPMVVLTACMAAMGATFAGVELSAVAYAGQRGESRWAGLVLACFAGGSAVAGLLYGTRTWRAPLGRRFRVQAVVFAVLPLALFAAVSLPALGLAVVVVGAGIAPMIITGFGLVEVVAGPRRLTEGLSWLTTGLSVGFGAAAAVTGGFADRYGARVSLLAPVGTAVVAGALGWWAVGLARRSRAATVPAGPGAASVPAGATPDRP